MRRSHKFSSLATFKTDEERIEWFDTSLKNKKTYPVNRRHLEFLKMLDRIIPAAERPQYRKVIEHWRLHGKHYSGKNIRDIMAEEASLYRQRKANQRIA